MALRRNRNGAEPPRPDISAAVDDARDPEPGLPAVPQPRRSRTSPFLRVLRRRDWIAVMIELVVVVLGILIALQLDQWAERRHERQLERSYLSRLGEDLEIEYERAADAERWARDRLAAVALLDAVASDAAAAGDAADLAWAIETASWRSFPRISAFVYNELQSTGQMRLVRSVALRRELADHYGSFVREAWVGEDRAAEQSFDEATAGLLSIEELMALERAAGDRRSIAVGRTRALALANGFSERPEAVRHLPSVAQHHLFNLRAIEEMKTRIRRLRAAVERELQQSAG